MHHLRRPARRPASHRTLPPPIVPPIGKLTAHDDYSQLPDFKTFGEAKYVDRADHASLGRLRLLTRSIQCQYDPKGFWRGWPIRIAVLTPLTGEDITIYGDGSQSRSFCYVDDLVDAILRMMETPPEVTGPINIGNPREFTILELAELVIAMTATKSKIKFERGCHQCQLDT
jgi:hypothetical protein